MTIQITDIDIHEAIKELNGRFYEEYKYVIFKQECKEYKEICHYVPLNFLTNCKNQLFIHETFLNLIFVENIKDIDEKYLIQMVNLLKHILKNNINQNEFNLSKEVKNIIAMHKNYKRSFKRNYKRYIYRAICKHYCQGNSFISFINYEMKKNEIAKKFLFKTIKNVENDIKKDTKDELVSEKLLSIIE